MVLPFTSLAQEVDTLNVAPVTTVPASHWSFSIKSGFNRFTMMPKAIHETDKFNLSVSGSLDYDVSPFVGLGSFIFFHNVEPKKAHGISGK